MCNLSQRDSMCIHSKKVCVIVPSKVLQNEHRTVFVVPKVHVFLLRNNTFLRILYWKEHQVVSIVSERENK